MMTTEERDEKIDKLIKKLKADKNYTFKPGIIKAIERMKKEPRYIHDPNFVPMIKDMLLEGYPPDFAEGSELVEYIDEGEE
jgi:hypothetical protein